MEIERKFLFHKLPDQLNTYPHYGIEQAYVTTNRLSGYARKLYTTQHLQPGLPIRPDCQKQWYVSSSTGI